MGAMLFKPNGRAYVMHDQSPTGHFWQDIEGLEIYITTTKYYEENGGMLTGPTVVPGTTFIVRIGNKIGQAKLVQ